jgi:hypothetical protein
MNIKQARSDNAATALDNLIQTVAQRFATCQNAGHDFVLVVYMSSLIISRNAFGIPYSVMFDTDGDQAKGPEKSKRVNDALGTALRISVQELDPRLETEMNLGQQKLHPPDVISMF